MSFSIRGRFKFAFNFLAFKIDNDQIFRLQLVIFDTGRFDYKETAFTINSADIAPSVSDKFTLREFHICFINFLLKLFQHFKKPSIFTNSYVKN